MYGKDSEFKAYSRHCTFWSMINLEYNIIKLWCLARILSVSNPSQMFNKVLNTTRICRDSPYKYNGSYLLKVNSGNNRAAMCEICSKLTIKTPERRQWRRSKVFIVNFQQISHIAARKHSSSIKFRGFLAFLKIWYQNNFNQKTLQYLFFCQLCLVSYSIDLIAVTIAK